MSNEENGALEPIGGTGDDNDGDELMSQDNYYDDEPSKFDRTLDYLETDKGHEVTQRVVKMLEDLSPTFKTLLEAKIAIHKASPKIEFSKWVALLVVRFLVFIAAISALIYMRHNGSIEPTVALLIGGLVAYFFGYNKQQS